MEPLQPGDLVLLRLELGWCRGIIKEVFPDPESRQVREVTVYTPRRTYRRPATAVAKIKIMRTDEGREETPANPEDIVNEVPLPGPMTRSRTRKVKDLLD